MSQTNEKFVCDRCGESAGNGGVFDSLIISDIDTDTGQVVNLHFCRTRYDSEGKKTKGCDEYILTVKDVEHYLSSRGEDMYQRPVKNKPTKEGTDR